ncbi:hypothetical protein HPB52_024242 [Rhipicephalus sanguineus]|uniref:Uncharacterized protein n=1 Tax=Rhipicephalus sanguineus TaxID=34632 RepID=A0A9D4SMJ8_RHISA|nr:hypothetical protein HPB52_024242 [Rhipicephalus sanguineus]
MAQLRERAIGSRPHGRCSLANRKGSGQGSTSLQPLLVAGDIANFEDLGCGFPMYNYAKHFLMDRMATLRIYNLRSDSFRLPSKETPQVRKARPSVKNERQTPGYDEHVPSATFNGTPIPKVETIRVLGLQIQKDGFGAANLPRLQRMPSQLTYFVRRVVSHNSGLEEQDKLRVIQALLTMPRSPHRGTSTWPGPARMRYVLAGISETERRGQLNDIFGVEERGMNRSPINATQRSPDHQRADLVKLTPVHERTSHRLRGDSPKFNPLHFAPTGTQTTYVATMTGQITTAQVVLNQPQKPPVFHGYSLEGVKDWLDLLKRVWSLSVRSDIEPLRKVIRSVIGEELSVLQAPQTITALSVVNVVRDDLRQVIWEPEREQQPIRRIPTYSEVLRQPALHSNVAVAMAAATRGHQVVHLVH